MTMRVVHTCRLYKMSSVLCFEYSWDMACPTIKILAWKIFLQNLPGTGMYSGATMGWAGWTKPRGLPSAEAMTSKQEN